MNTVTITEFEKQLLEAINSSEYGSELGDSIWVFSPLDEVGFVGKQASGVVSSLSKKGLVKTDGKGNDQEIWLTELGMQLCKEMNLLGKYA